MKKSSKSTLRTVIIMVFVSIFIVTAYFCVRTGMVDGVFKSDEKKEKNKYEKILEKDIENNYPSTPKEVLRLYIEISKCFYEKGLTDEQMEKLADKLYLLLDDELIAQNEKSEYIINLKSEVKEFRNNNLAIMNYYTSDKDNKEFWTKDSREYASRIATYTIKEDKNYTKVYNNFVFRKDDAGKWKILGWTIEDTKETTVEAISEQNKTTK